MDIFKAFFVAVSTYSALPVPQFSWTEKTMRYAICFFPAVGLFCGAALWLWYVFARGLDLSPFLFSAVAACIPLLVTGGIHMDGYMDTVDAISSRLPRERKLEIMKDPNCGAFAVIYCAMYLLVYTALVYESYRLELVPLLCPVFVLSRCLSGLTAVNMPNARRSGMLCAFTQNAHKRTANCALTIVLILSGLSLVLLRLKTGLLMLAASALCLLLYRSMAMKNFGGATGDSFGFFLQICELACLAAAVLGGGLL